MNFRKILIIPNKVECNKLHERFNEILDKSSRLELKRIKFNKIKDLFSFDIISSSFSSKNKIDAILLHWHDNHLVGKNNRVSLIGILKYFFLLIYFKLISKKLYYFHHNYHPHALTGFEAFLAKIIIQFGSYFSDSQFSMNPDDKNKKIFYIPHPLFKVNKINSSSRIKRDDFYLLFGIILPYKQFDNVIANWISDKKLIIAGSSPSSKYLDYLKSISKGKNVIFYPNFQTENQMTDLFRKTEALILPQVNASCRVSSNLYLALSHQTSIMAIKDSFSHSVKNFHSLKDIFIYEDVKCLCKAVDNGFEKSPKNEKNSINDLLSDQIIKSYYKKYLSFTN